MFRTLKSIGGYRFLRVVCLAGMVGGVIAFGMMEIIASFGISANDLSIAPVWVICALCGVLAVVSAAAWHVKQTLSEQNRRLHGALENMTHGLCMFDAQNRLLVWNERYRAMYNIDPRRIRAGCAGRELLKARVEAGTFPLDPERYRSELLAALARGETFTLTVEMADGRVISVVNSPMQGGGWVTTHEDVTERKRAECDLERTRSFLDTVIENVPSPIIVKDVPDLRYLLINRAAEKYLGVERNTMLGKTAVAGMPKATAKYVEAEDRRVVEAGAPIFLGEHAVATPANGTRIVTSTRLPVKGSDGKPQYIISVINDMTERKRDEQRLAHLVHHDPLTDLPNRLAFNEYIASSIETAAKAGENFGVLCIDLDHFKAVNDVFGPVIGDKLLSQLADRLKSACDGEFLARIGGDEFAVITRMDTSPAATEALAERLIGALATDIEIDGHSLRAGLTVGIGIFPQDGKDAATLLANAGAALSRAKSEARGTLRFFESSMDQELRAKRVLQQDLRSALAHDEIALHYQPLADINGDFTGFEALVRWNHPRQGMVAPSTFIPLAEESGVIVEMGEWILRTACREAASWPKHLRISVNLSPVQFQHGDLPLLVHQILLETGLEPARLELEITEGALIGDFARALSILRRLKNLGVRIAMDDFGTGYSSLSYLQSFPFDRIKIDRSFVANVDRTQQAAAIIRAVIALGRGLELPVVAEGVETEDQLKFLAGENCNEVQGYLIGRPKPIDAYGEVVGRQSGQDAAMPARRIVG